MKTTIPSEGISLRCVAAEQQNTKPPLFATVFLGLIAFFIVASLGGFLISLLELSVYGVVLLAGCALFAGMCAVFFRCPKLRIPLLIGGALLFFLLLILSGKNGFAVFMNSVKDLYGAALGRVFLPYAISANGNEKLSVTVFLLAVAMVVSVIASYSLFARSKVIYFLVFLILPFLLIPAFISPHWSWYILLGYSLFLSIVVGISNSTTSKGSPSVFLFIALLLGAVMLLLLPLGFGFGFEQPKVAAKAETSLAECWDQIRYGKDNTNNFPEGDFSAVDSFVYTEDTALEITMSEPQSLYLRGYVGTDYTEKGWETVEKSALYEYADLFYWLHEGGFFGTSQVSLAAMAAGVSESPITVTVENINAKEKYIYAPYEFLDSNVGKASFRIGDVALNPKDYKDASAVTYTMLPNQVRDAKALAETLGSLYQRGDANAVSYLEMETAYRDFVYATALDLPKETKTVLETHLGKVEPNGIDYTQTIQNIYDVLLGSTTYNENCGALPQDTDLLRYFLEISTEGYSVHYATAATLMFRYYGIPARYVEGYIVTPADVAAAEGNTITIDGGNAHAWVEYYRDGVGWIPLETTPPYLFIMEQPGEIQSLVSDTLNQNSNQSGMVQMEEDNYEELEEEKAKPQDEASSSPWLMVVLMASVLCLLLIIAVVVLILRRRKAIRAREQEIEAADPRVGVDMLFADTLQMLFTAGIKEENGSLDQYIAPLEADPSSDIVLRYKMFCKLHRESRFSDHPITDDRKRIFRLFRNEAEQYAKTHSRLIKRLRDQYIHHRY